MLGLFFYSVFMYYNKVIPTTYMLLNMVKASLQEDRKASFYDGHFF